ncbi:MAG: HAMP domain-containing histidine kinase [Clostridiales bacterium]|nr:HAMP domain-containing histidine kinase [Clostridiales bacterium]
MNDPILLASLLCLTVSAGIVVWNRWHTRRLFRRLTLMLEDGIKGTFSETVFNESQFSALESRLAQYLSASELSARNLQAEKDKIKTLIGDISHQTKTPIANLLLYAELLAEQELPAEAAEQVESLHFQAEKLCFLIDSLIKLSRLETGILTLSPTVRPLQPILEKAVRQFAPLAEAKGLTLTVEPTTASAACDSKWTAEALGNLVDNAIKYTDHGAVTLRVISYELFTCIQVQDTGMGIPESEQAQIFTRFYRSQQVSQKAGVGIGLSLAREIISGQGGYIKLTSQPQKGSIFSVYLPSDSKENRNLTKL